MFFTNRSFFPFGYFFNGFVNFCRICHEGLKKRNLFLTTFTRFHAKAQGRKVYSLYLYIGIPLIKTTALAPMEVEILLIFAAKKQKIGTNSGIKLLNKIPILLHYICIKTNPTGFQNLSGCGSEILPYI